MILDFLDDGVGGGGPQEGVHPGVIAEVTPLFGLSATFWGCNRRYSTGVAC